MSSNRLTEPEFFISGVIVLFYADIFGVKLFLELQCNTFWNIFSWFLSMKPHIPRNIDSGPMRVQCRNRVTNQRQGKYQIGDLYPRSKRQDPVLSPFWPMEDEYRPLSVCQQPHVTLAECSLQSRTEEWNRRFYQIIQGNVRNILCFSGC